mgnify:CR=1 FL=1
MEDIRERFIKVIEFYCSGNQSKFARTIGVSQGNISNIFSRGTTPSSELISKTSIVFPKLNLRWLLTGEGEIEMSTNENLESNIEITNRNLSETVKSLSRTIENLTNK